MDDLDIEGEGLMNGFGSIIARAIRKWIHFQGHGTAVPTLL
jgi:hypothetical protein